MRAVSPLAATAAAIVADIERQRREGVKNTKQSRRMIQYRQMKKEELLTLDATIEHLAVLKKQLREKSQRRGPKDLLLPWREVARALKDLRRLGDCEHEELQRKLAASQSLMHEMYQWVAAQYAVIQDAPDARRPTWRSTSLPRGEASRRLGKEWILNQLYHNTDALFQQYGFPALDSPERLYMDFHFNFSDTQGYSYVTRHFLQIHESMEGFLARYRRTLLTDQCAIRDLFPATHPMLIEEEDDQTHQLALITPRGEYVNLLCGTFRSENRVTFLGRQIQDDERCCSNHRQRNRIFIAELHQMPNGTVMGRGLWIQTQGFTPDGSPLSLDDDAIEFDVDLRGCPDHLKQARYPRLFEDAIKRHFHDLDARDASESKPAHHQGVS
ncbi:Aste57867_10932 [Aphanomyces stellatus]|uniref:Aste57867_10932 protein n=1 Tax=Aphanomyces stellatus TaxID=120398 RepID=A0A485KRL4_9STRA|nr:hypothetical protein As57867_010892 [Aphanomyces stellatus]VFT87800.1 Aste57867_10932 [Aphanomyces stellatus]